MENFLKHIKARQNADFTKDKQINSCIKLWFAVCEQAFSDVERTSRKPRALIDKRKAMEWLISESKDLELVCSMTGIDHKQLHIAALKLFRKDKRNRRLLASILNSYRNKDPKELEL